MMEISESSFILATRRIQTQEFLQFKKKKNFESFPFPEPISDWLKDSDSRDGTRRYFLMASEDWKRKHSRQA